jgi:hypothetical protein
MKYRIEINKLTKVDRRRSTARGKDLGVRGRSDLFSMISSAQLPVASH